MTCYFLGHSTKIGEDVYDAFGVAREFSDEKEYADLVLERGGALFVSAEELAVAGLQLTDFEKFPSTGTFPEHVEDLPEEDRAAYTHLRSGLDSVHAAFRNKCAAHLATKAATKGAK